MQNVKVDPDYLDRLTKFIGKARTSLDAGFGAPRSVSDSYPDKLFETHGVTARAGSNAIMAVLDAEREAVHTHLNKCLQLCDVLLQKAKGLYLATDAAQADSLSEQIKS